MGRFAPASDATRLSEATERGAQAVPRIRAGTGPIHGSNWAMVPSIPWERLGPSAFYGGSTRARRGYLVALG
jgi:hypothetical protein